LTFSRVSITYMTETELCSQSKVGKLFVVFVILYILHTWCKCQKIILSVAKSAHKIRLNYVDAHQTEFNRLNIIHGTSNNN